MRLPVLRAAAHHLLAPRPSIHRPVAAAFFVGLGAARHTPTTAFQTRPLSLHSFTRFIPWPRDKQLPQAIGPPDSEEEAVRAAILDKALQGRQPADLMLRCEFMRRFTHAYLRDSHSYAGTVLDAEGLCSLKWSPG